MLSLLLRKQAAVGKTGEEKSCWVRSWVVVPTGYFDLSACECVGVSVCQESVGAPVCVPDETERERETERKKETNKQTKEESEFTDVMHSGL